MTWNLKGGLIVKMIKICQMGKLAELERKWCAQCIPNFFSLLHFFAEVCVILAFAVVHIAGVWAYFHPLTIGHAMSN